MKAENLLDAIGDVKNAYIAELAGSRRSRSRRPWLAAIAACLALVLMIGLGNLGAQAEIGGEGDGLGYYIYEGPVLPLTVQGDSAGLSAQRSVWMDFGAYDPDSEKPGHYLQLTDTYTLTSDGDTDRTVTLLYPYIGENRPPISVDGDLVLATIHPGAYAGGFMEGVIDLDLPNCFADFEALLTGTDYFEDAFDGFPALDIPAYVYRLHDFTGTQKENDDDPVLSMAFSVEPGRSRVLSDGFNGGSWDPENGQYRKFRWSSAPCDEDSFVIVVGTDLKEYTVQGFRTEDCAPGDELDALSCTITRYETTLDEVLGYFLEKNWGDEMERMDASRRYAIPAAELYRGLAAEHLLKWGPLSEKCMRRYADGDLKHILYDSHNAVRINWLSFDVTIPAGGSVTVKATTQKEASTNVDRGSHLDGYELATALGSNLTFTGQTATIGNTKWIEIRGQNFGFSLEKGITTVTLDPEVACYWIKVRCRAHG